MLRTVLKNKLSKKRILTFALSFALSVSVLFTNTLCLQATSVSEVNEPESNQTVTDEIVSHPSKNLSRVEYSPYSITKGNNTTTIWIQQKYWPKKSSASRSGCGYCCVAMALKLSGITKSNPQMVLKAAKRSVRRAGPLKAKKAVKICQKYGIPATEYSTQSLGRNNSVKLIKSALDQGKMVMTLVRGGNFSGGTHWVLLTGYDNRGKIVVANSSLGTRKYCKKAGLQYHLVTLNHMKKTLIPNGKWNGFVVIGK